MTNFRPAPKRRTLAVTERDIYLRASLVVGAPRQWPEAPDFINPRTFLLAALGVPQVLEDRLELAPLFDLTNESLFSDLLPTSARWCGLLKTVKTRETSTASEGTRALGHLLQHRVAQLLDM